MILPFELAATLTAATPVAYDLSDGTDNPNYDTTPGVPARTSFLISCAVVADGEGVTVVFGTSDAGGANFTPVLPLPMQPHIYLDGRVDVPLSATRKPALQVTSKSTQNVRLVGHVELGSRN